MYGKRAAIPLLVALAVAFEAGPLLAGSFLFDGTKHEMAGNADWVIDADVWNQNMPAYPCTGSTNESNPAADPTPAAATVTLATPETYWKGAVSAWAIELVKAGHTVQSLPAGAALTYGNGGNPQDLSLYDVLVVVEPQNPFSVAEKTAILAFVSAGGGLFMVADHETSDRDCDGWDSPHVWNDLTGATSAASTGLFGIWFRVDGADVNPSEDWFDEAVNANVETAPSDPIINGPSGSGAGGLGLFGSTSMDLNPLDNATAVAHVWRMGQAHGNLRATFATAAYGAGRVAAIGDSSPADDGTGDTGDSLHPGWDKATGGVRNREIHLNACEWLLDPAPDTTAPVINSGPVAAPLDCSAKVSWTTDEPATSVVEYGATVGYGQSGSTPGLTQSHAVEITGLLPSSTYYFRVSSSDAVGNGPTQSAGSFATTPAAPPSLTQGPAISNVGGTTATVTWTTDEPATSVVEYGLTPSYGDTASTPGPTRQHQVVLTALTPLTTYHYDVLSADACGNGPTTSSDATFTTGPAALDISGWTLKQFSSTQSYVFPAGTAIPSDGYLVVARDADRSQFAAFFPSMPAATVFLDSNANGSCPNGCLPQVNGAETFELWDATSKVDGPTIAMASNNAYQRKNPGDPAGVPSSWNVLPEGGANPGQGAGVASHAGVRINEMADASDYTKEFVELYYDASFPPPDFAAPAAVQDLAATPTGATSVHLSWTAPGDDGSTGTATAYDLRYASSPIVSRAAFDGAAALVGEPAPATAGTVQSFEATGLVANRTYFFALVVADEVPNESSVSNSAGATTGPNGGGGGANHLVIGEVQTNGNGVTPADDEFVELHNPTGSSVALGGRSLQYKSATGSTYSVLALSGSVPAGGFYLIARSAYNGSVAPNLVATTIQMAAAGGNLYLVNGTTALTSCNAATIIDRVAWGTGNCPETTAVAAPPANGSIERRPGAANVLCGNGTDTDSNAADFVLRTVSEPQNASSASETCGSGLGNVGFTLQVAPAGGLQWTAAMGATGYKVRRSALSTFMIDHPLPDDTYLIASPPAPAYQDTANPAPGVCWFYFVNATLGSLESIEDTQVW